MSTIPRFFTPKPKDANPHRKVIAGSRLEDKLETLVAVFRRYQEGWTKGSAPPGSDEEVTVAGVQVRRGDLELRLSVDNFAAVAKTVCGFPSYFASPLFLRLRKQFGDGRREAGFGPSRTWDGTWHCDDPGIVPPKESDGGDSDGMAKDSILYHTRGHLALEVLLHYWRESMEGADDVTRFYELVAQPGSDGIVPKDFHPFLEELLAYHPGLAFLESTPEFQEKYARTVLARIMAVCDPLATGKIALPALKRSGALSAFQLVDVEEDINFVTDFFSYEHFYVLYCKFWELDEDKDFLLDRANLDRLSELTPSVLDRVWGGAGRPSVSPVEGKMCYEDFVCFLLAEEDKTNETSLRYWFRVVDVDGDGIITPQDMQYFYKEQAQRMTDLCLEAVSFHDILTQMTDFLHPSTLYQFTLGDFLNPDRICIAGNFFSVLFNLAKFTLWEQREPNTVKAEPNSGEITAWDRFAATEYVKLAEEEEESMAADEELSMELDSVESTELGEWGVGGP
jgi:Ca2+-binding EF-hand superfamily protein